MGMTPGMQWAELVNQMGNQGTQAALGGIAAGQRGQQIDVEKQAEQRMQQQQYEEELTHALQNGAKYVGPGGMVQESTPGPDGNPIVTHRPVNPDRYVSKYKNPADGTSVQLEWPSQQEQIQTQIATRGREAQAQTAGAGAGQTEAKVQDREQRGVVPSEDEAQKFGLRPDQKYLPEELDVIRRSVIPAQVRGQTQRDVTGMRDDSAERRAQLRADTQKQLEDTKEAFSDDQNKRKLDFQNRWAQARNAISSNTQSSLNNRELMRQFDSNEAQHGKLLDSVYKERQKQLEAQALLDPKATPDAGDFTDPWSGKKMTMNIYQRQRLKNGIDDSNSNISGWLSRAQQIADRYNLGAFNPQTGGGVAPAGAAAPGTVNASPAGGAVQKPGQKGGRIRVKLSSGQTGTIDASEFDSKTMTKVQ